jgi:hypothetical protein
MWLNEVMEEERLASKDSKKEELEQEAKDHEELMKEVNRRNSVTGVAEVERSGSRIYSSGLGRNGSKMSGVSGMLRSASRRGADPEMGERPVVGSSPRPDMGRGLSGGSAASRTSGRSGSSLIVYPPKTAPL